VADAVRLLHGLAGISKLTPAERALGDANLNGTLDSGNAVLLLGRAVGR
jgi:hypothetical protein